MTVMTASIVCDQVQEEFVLEHMTEVFTCLRCCNVALRWLFLHTCSSHKKLRGGRRQLSAAHAGPSGAPPGYCAPRV